MRCSLTVLLLLASPAAAEIRELSSETVCLVAWGPADSPRARAGYRAIHQGTALNAILLVELSTGERARLGVRHTEEHMNRFGLSFTDVGTGWSTDFTTDVVVVGDGGEKVLDPSEIASAARDGRYSELQWLESSDGLHLEVDATRKHDSSSPADLSSLGNFRPLLDATEPGLRAAPRTARDAMAEVRDLLDLEHPAIPRFWEHAFPLWSYAFHVPERAGSKSSEPTVECAVGLPGEAEKKVRDRELSAAVRGIVVPKIKE